MTWKLSGMVHVWRHYQQHHIHSLIHIAFLHLYGTTKWFRTFKFKVEKLQFIYKYPLTCAISHHMLFISIYGLFAFSKHSKRYDICFNTWIQNILYIPIEKTYMHCMVSISTGKKLHVKTWFRCEWVGFNFPTLHYLHWNVFSITDRNQLKFTANNLNTEFQFK